MELKVEDVIASNYINEYEETRKIIYDQMVFIKNNLIVMRKIIDFPFPLFVGHFRQPFWSLTSKAYFDSTILALWTICRDGDGEFRLQRLRTKVMKDWKRGDIDSAVEKHLRQEIKAVDFDKRIEDLSAKIDNVRNKHIAHLDFNEKMGKSNRVIYNLAWSELDKAVTIMNELFQILFFGGEAMLAVVDYSQQQVDSNQTDVDKLLNSIAEKSFWFRPNPYLTDRRRKRFDSLPQQDREELLGWKERLGIPFSFEM